MMWTPILLTTHLLPKPSTSSGKYCCISKAYILSLPFDSGINSNVIPETLTNPNAQPVTSHGFLTAQRKLPSPTVTSNSKDLRPTPAWSRISGTWVSHLDEG